jgi:hypothetical protein
VNEDAHKPGAAEALAAARAVAHANGIVCEDAVVLAAGSNVLAHLRPAPVMARVMTGTAMLHADPGSWLAREVAVGAFLAQRGLGVAPSDLLAPGPHESGGLWMTFWEFVDHDRSRALPSAHALGGALRELHAALAEFRGELGPLAGIRDWLEALIAELRPSPALTLRQRDALRSRLHAIAPDVFESSLPAQPIHGDASMSNLLATPRGLIWNDFEDACLGPVHWDVAGLVVDARAAGASEGFVAEFLAAYDGPGLDELEEFIEAHIVYMRVWRAFAAQSGRAPSAARPA